MKSDKTQIPAALVLKTTERSTIAGETIPHVFKRSTIKKLPPDLRKPKIKYDREPVFYKRFLWRLREDSQFLRSTVQVTFLLLCVWIGVEFYLFVRWGSSQGAGSFIDRPPGAEGFLPISALISLKYYLLSGIVNTIHPAGLFIFLAILIIGFLCKKAFCSWLCPVGTLSESLWILGNKIFGKNIAMPRWLDYPLRSIKYLLLLFFVYIIWQMDELALKMFIESPYNKVADIKMYYYFAHVSSFALWTIVVLIALSVCIKNFWCRYLCPYGALLGFIGWVSPLKVTRNSSTCIDCELCTKACPANISVHKATRIVSDECMNCLECVQVCPVKNTLDLRLPISKTRVPNWVFGVLVVGIFIAVTGFAMLSGHWQNGIKRDEYLKHFQQIDSPVYSHERAIR